MDILRRPRVGAFEFALVSVIALSAQALAAEEPAGGKPADAAPPAAKKAVDASRRVPPFFGQVGLTPEQKEEIYKIRASRQARIDSLRQELTKLHAEVLTECESVLSESQRKLLIERREAAARARAAKGATAVAPAPSKPADKPGS